MIAFRYTAAGVVTRRRVASSLRILDKPRTLVLAHARKLDGTARNVVDISAAPPEALTAPLYTLSVTTGPLVLVYDATATPPPDPFEVAVEELRAAPNNSAKVAAMLSAYDATRTP